MFLRFPIVRVVWLAFIFMLTPHTKAGIASDYYLVSSGDGRILRYSTSGEYIDNLVPSQGNALGNPQHMVVHNNKLFVTGYSNNTLSRIDLDTGAIEQQWQLDNARGTAFLRESPDGSEFWIGAINSNRILRVNPDNGAVIGDLVPPGAIPGPHGILSNSDGSLLIAANDHHIYRSSDDGIEQFITTTAPRPTNMLWLHDGSLLVSAFDNNPTRALRRYDPDSGGDLGVFSATQGGRADGLIRANNGEILAVFWGSNSIKRYSEDGTYLGDFANASEGLSKPNHILYVPAPSTTALLLPSALVSSKRRR